MLVYIYTVLPFGNLLISSSLSSTKTTLRYFLSTTNRRSAAAWTKLCPATFKKLTTAKSLPASIKILIILEAPSPTYYTYMEETRLRLYCWWWDSWDYSPQHTLSSCELRQHGSGAEQRTERHADLNWNLSSYPNNSYEKLDSRLNIGVGVPDNWIFSSFSNLGFSFNYFL
jgi:hypothetical protein